LTKKRTEAGDARAGWLLHSRKAERIKAGTDGTDLRVGRESAESRHPVKSGHVELCKGALRLPAL
jgi:hypothetical protein